jgi:hypothetical protein
VKVLPLILGFLPITLLSDCSIGGDREEANATSLGSIEDSKDLLALFCLGFLCKHVWTAIPSITFYCVLMSVCSFLFKFFVVNIHFRLKVIHVGCIKKSFYCHLNLFVPFANRAFYCRYAPLEFDSI